jgi:heme/copper-type cytochrome/quinol oxidase subunit 2
MAEQNSHADDLRVIRKIMEDSSRFLSLSGLSGVFTGLLALVGAYIAWFFILDNGDMPYDRLLEGNLKSEIAWIRLALFIDAFVILIIAICISFLMSYRKAKREGSGLWNPVTRRMMIYFSIPLLAAAGFIIILLTHADYQYIPSVMLVFYGLALVSIARFTFGEVQYLGLFEIITGLIAGFFVEYGILFWAFGFGFLHILYGLIMYRKYR